MNLLETEVIRNYVKKTKPVYFKKFHGNKFQSNFPDTIFVFDEGEEPKFYEFKVSDTLRVPWAKFKLGQHLECLKMASAGIYVRYMIYVRDLECLYDIPIFMVKENEPYVIHENQIPIYKGALAKKSPKNMR